MKNFIFIFLGLCAILNAYGQPAPQKKLYIVDSIHFLNESEVLSQLQPAEIADTTTSRNNNKMLMPDGKRPDMIIYVFTKEYRHRPDSLKRIPGMKRMSKKENVLYLAGEPYTGRYIDYYTNGKIQAEGNLLHGKQHDECIVYYPNGKRKTVASYDWGLRHGYWKEYYKTGTLAMEGEFSHGRLISIKQYFLNGQLKQEKKRKAHTSYDTMLVYFSTGKINIQRVSKTGQFYPGDKEIELGEDSFWFYYYLRENDLKKANKYFYRIWKTDSSSLETHYDEGILMMHEFRYEEAIAHFNRVLEIEPLMQEALVNRAIARIKKYKHAAKRNSGIAKEYEVLVDADLIYMPDYEKVKLCRDLQLVEAMDLSVNYRHKLIHESILGYCRKMADQ